MGYKKKTPAQRLWIISNSLQSYPQATQSPKSNTELSEKFFSGETRRKPRPPGQKIPATQLNPKGEKIFIAGRRYFGKAISKVNAALPVSKWPAAGLFKIPALYPISEGPQE